MSSRSVWIGALLLIDQIVQQFMAPSSRHESWLGVPVLARILVLLYFTLAYKQFSGYQKSAAILVIAGTLSNALDLVFRGYIPDYLPVGSLLTNLSDIQIIVGLIWFGIVAFKPSKAQ